MENIESIMGIPWCGMTFWWLITYEETAEGKLLILGKFIIENLCGLMDTSESNVYVLIGGVVLEKFVFASLS